MSGTKAATGLKANVRMKTTSKENMSKGSNPVKKKKASKEKAGKKKDRKKTTNAPKKKKNEKKREQKEDSDSEKSDSEDSELSANSEITLRNPSIPKEPLPGALRNVPLNSDQFCLRLMREERPDLFDVSCTVNNAEAEAMDYYLRDKNELAPADLVYIDDNFDEEERSYVRYQIEMKYNEGRYSSAYVVTKQTCKENTRSTTKDYYLLKMPLRKYSATADKKLNREIRLLMMLNQQKVDICPVVVDHGKICDGRFFGYLQIPPDTSLTAEYLQIPASVTVMSLLDTNLEKLRESLDGKFNGPTALYIGLETLKCLTELHLRGFVHHDVKPANFCIGLGAQKARIYLIDYGETVQKGKKLEIPPADGLTLPYMSLDQHKGYAAREKSDIESWFYMLIDFLHPGLISWKFRTNDAEVEKAKTQFWKGFSIDSGISDKRIQALGELLNTKTTFEKADHVKMKQLLTIAFDAMMGRSKFLPQWCCGN